MAEPITIVASSIEMVPVASLLEYPGNAKRHPDNQIARLAGMIREFGWTVPLLIDSGGMLIAGHARLAAARKLEMEAVPCVRATHLSRAQIKALVIADNKIAEGGAWDLDILRVELPQIAELDEELLGLTGFEGEELDALLGEVDDVESLSGDPEESEGAKADFLTFGGKRVEISERELEALLRKYDAHIELFGTPHGFVARTLLPLEVGGK